MRVRGSTVWWRSGYFTFLFYLAVLGFYCHADPLQELTPPLSGQTPQPSGNSGQNLNPPSGGLANSNQGLDELSQSLNDQMTDLLSLQTYLKRQATLLSAQSRDNAELKNLLDSSEMTITSLKESLSNSVMYAEQLGERLQEADEWNAELQDENDTLTQKVYSKDIRILKLVIAIIGLSVIIAGYIALKVLKFYGKIQSGGLLGFIL
jgi:hypothetical protein